MKKEQDLTKWSNKQKMLRRPPPPRQKKWVDKGPRLNTVQLRAAMIMTDWTI